MLGNQILKLRLLKSILCFLTTGLASQIDAPPMPRNVPFGSVWNSKANTWILRTIDSGFDIQDVWTRQGKQVERRIRNKEIEKVYGFFNDNKLLTKGQQMVTLIPTPLAPEKSQGYYDSLPYGRLTMFRDGRISGKVCNTILPQAKKEDILNEWSDYINMHGEAAALKIKIPRSYPCGTAIEYNPDGSIKNRHEFPDKCLQGCGEFKPFIPPGKYKVHATSVIFRDKPSTKGKSLGTIQKGTELQVIEDTHKIETHDFETAPWVKVRLTPSPSPQRGEGSKKEQVGYVFGGFLDSLERNDL